MFEQRISNIEVFSKKVQPKSQFCTQPYCLIYRSTVDKTADFGTKLRMNVCKIMKK